MVTEIIKLACYLIGKKMSGLLIRFSGIPSNLRGQRDSKEFMALALHVVDPTPALLCYSKQSGITPQPSNVLKNVLVVKTLCCVILEQCNCHLLVLIRLHGPHIFCVLFHVYLIAWVQ